MDETTQAITIGEISATIPDEKMVLGEDDLLAFNKCFYNVALLDMEHTEPDDSHVYLYGDYFYPYRGQWFDASMDNKPGIYWDDGQRKIIRLDPLTDEDKETYTYAGKIVRPDFSTIKNLVNSGNLKFAPLPESSQSYITPVKSSDDILKRLAKLAFQEKGVSSNDYREGFQDKNAIFNFKSVLKGDKRLSMLLFDRGMSALNLKYSIILEEKDPVNPVANPLQHKLIATSEDTYEL